MTPARCRVAQSGSEPCGLNRALEAVELADRSRLSPLEELAVVPQLDPRKAASSGNVGGRGRDEYETSSNRQDGLWSLGSTHLHFARHETRHLLAKIVPQPKIGQPTFPRQGPVGVP